MNPRLAAAGLAAFACIAGCAERNAAVPAHNADERLADAVLDAIQRRDMRPVVSKFVKEREPQLLDPAEVTRMHDFAASAGEFLGVREVPRARDTESNTRYFVATFSGGREALTMILDDAGKIVHFRLAPSSA